MTDSERKGNSRSRESREEVMLKQTDNCANIIQEPLSSSHAIPVLLYAFLTPSLSSTCSLCFNLSLLEKSNRSSSAKVPHHLVIGAFKYNAGAESHPGREKSKNKQLVFYSVIKDFLLLIWGALSIHKMRVYSSKLLNGMRCCYIS